MGGSLLQKAGGILKDVDLKTRTVAGYFSIFDQVDTDNDIILPGAYAKSIRERGPMGKNRIYHLWMHWTDSILSKPKELKEDNTGLFFVSEFAPEDKQTNLQKDVLRLYDQGLLTEHSVGFQIEQSENREDGVRLIKEIKLWEGSTVTWGAQELARTTEVKSMDKPVLMDRLDRLIKALHEGYFTDETYQALEYEMTIIKQSLESLEQAAAQSTAEITEPTDEDLLKMFRNKLQFN